MDFSLVFLVALALTGAAHGGPVLSNNRAVSRSSELNEIFAEFAALVPQDKVIAIALEYYQKDAEVQAVVKYVQSEDFKHLVTKVESIEDVINFYDFLDKAGLDIYHAVNALHEAIGLPPLVPGNFARNVRITGGISGLIADVKALLPLDKIKALYHEKLETSAAFADLVHHFQSPRFQELINALRANEEFQKMVIFAKAHGVDVRAIVDLLVSVLGLEFPENRVARSAVRSSELNEIFAEFAALVPQDKVIAIALEYLEKDAEVQAVVEYVQSEDFKHLVTKVESIEDVINFYDYLDKAGLDIYHAVNALHEAIGLPPLVPGNFARNVRITGGVSGLIADVKALLPLDKIKALYHEKLETSAAFADLVHHFQSPRFQELINALRANEEFQKMVIFAKAHGVDVRAIVDLLVSVLGLEFPENRVARSAVRSSELNEIFAEFAALVPQDKVIAIALEYLEKDAEVQAVVEYVQSEDFKHLVTNVESIEDVINFYDYLDKAGLDIYHAVNALHEAIGLPPLVPGNFARNVRITGGVSGLIADVKALLPLDKIKALYHEKLETSAAFADLVHHFQSPRFQELINALRANEEFQKMLTFAKDHGVDVKAIVDLLSTALGLEFPGSRSVFRSSELHQVFEEFLALMPLEKFHEIVLDYVKNDPEVQDAIHYFESDAFRNFVLQAESIEDVINFYDYLDKAGLDIYGAVNGLHMVIGLPPLVPGGHVRHIRSTGGLSGLIADIKAILPVDKIKALYHEKLETSPAFAQLVAHFQSDKFQQLINRLRANEEFQKMLSFSKQHGVDVAAIVDLLSSMFGLEFPESRAAALSSELNEIFAEFAALVPKDKVVAIALEYLEKDPEVQAVVEYVQSEAFKDLVRKVESIEDVINFYDYLDKAGLDIYHAVNKLHEALGLPPLVPGNYARNVRITGGVAGLIADVKALLPLDKIKALYHEKLETSAAFADLVHHFQSPRFQELINALRANKEFRQIVAFAKEHGVDVKAIVDLLSTALGLEFPESRVARSAVRSSELNEIFAEFAALVPQDKVIAIALEYYQKDAEVQAVVKYIQSEDFKHLVTKVESIEDVINFYDYLDKAGLDIYLAVNKLHEALGLPPLVPGNFARNVRITGGVAGLIADVKALLPLDKIKALYHEKLETSAAFADLVHHFQSPRFQELINALRANVEFQKIVKFAKEHGVDVKAIIDLLSTALGLEFPESRAVARSSELHEIFLEFAALVPQDKVVEIFMEYLEKDAEVQAAIEYVQSEDFKDLVRKVESIEDVINFYDSLEEAGLDIYAAVNRLHELLGLPPLKPGNVARNVRITGGVAGFYADVKAILPLDKIKALYHEKLETSAAFADLVAHFQSPRFQELINTLRANPEFRHIVAYAKEHGIDVAAIVDFLKTLLGLEFPESQAVARSSELYEIFQEFVALVPQDKLVEIGTEYYENDAEVQAAVQYVQSEDFKDLVRKVESIEDVINFYDSLEEAGLDIYGAVNRLHELLGLPPLKPGNLARNVRITGGVAGFYEDVKAILPLDKIKALYHEKLETSAAFAGLVAHFQSPRFQELINTLRANPEFRHIVAYAKEHGIDVAAIVDFLKTLLGLEFPDQPRFVSNVEINNNGLSGFRRSLYLGSH